MVRFKKPEANRNKEYNFVNELEHKRIIIIYQFNKNTLS